MERNEAASGFILELRRGTITLCVLSKLRTKAYGYSLVSELEKSGIPVEANTLYPMLRRLESQGLLKSAWNTDAAKPRKYYQTTELGEQTLNILKKNWQDTVLCMKNILEGSTDEQ